MSDNVIIPNQPALEKTIVAMAKDGVEKLQVLADFDRTLTKCFIDGQKIHTLIAQLNDPQLLGPIYPQKNIELFEHYHPIEMATQLSRVEKSQHMDEWWHKVNDLLIKHGLSKQIMQKVVAKRTLKFRAGLAELVDILDKHNIPLVIMSASLGDMVEMYLKQEGIWHDNIHIISNFAEFDEHGKVVAWKLPIIHSLNKYEVMLKDSLAFQKIEARSNVILLGDIVEDIGMIEGFAYNNLISVGFLNHDIEARLGSFKETFDVMLTNDTEMGFVNKLINKIL